MKKTNDALAEKYISYRKEALEKIAVDFVEWIKPKLEETAKRGLCAFTLTKNGDVPREFSPFFYYHDARRLLEVELGGVEVWIQESESLLFGLTITSLQFTWYTGNENPEPGADSDDE
jgi:hypothetical protein